MIKNIWKRWLSVTLVLLMFGSLLPGVAWAADLPLAADGLSASYDGGTWTADDTTIVGSVTTQTKSGCTGPSHTPATGTLTLTNTSDSVGILSFAIAPEANGGSVKLDNEAVSAAGGVTKKLEAGETVTVVISSSGSEEKTTKVTLSDLRMNKPQDVETTFAKPVNGSYTVDGTSITADTAMTKLSSLSYAITAAPAEGYKFYGWKSSVSGYVSYKASDSLMLMEPQTIEPVFLPSTTPVFQVDGASFTDLNKATEYATAQNKSKITLVSAGTLPAGTYSIPGGKTLLIPFDEAGTMYTTEPTVVYGSHTTPSAFRTLTMDSGAKLTVQNGGAISVSSKLSAAGTGAGSWNGTPTGPYGHIKMNDNSAITLEKGANLYCYGYISGSGAVKAESGAAVYECFQLRCWRGGSATSSMPGKKVFPMSQYYVQNIEAPLTLNAGATEKVCTAVNASKQAFPASATFIGAGGMFVPSGSITKRYDGAYDRLIIDVDGDLTLSPLALRIPGIPMIGTLDLNTSDFVLPINSNITVNVNSGTTTVAKQDIAFLPGSALTIAENAAVEISNGSNVYVYDRDQWGAYAAAGQQLVAVGYSAANAAAAKRDAAGLEDAKIDVNGTLNISGALYTTQSGAAIVSSAQSGKVVLKAAAGTEKTTQQVTQSGSDITYVDIPVTAAQLQNADGSYYQTDGKPAGTNIPYADGLWGGEAPAELTITFDANGGTGAMDVQTVKTAVDTALTANTFSREGYTFTGWNTKPDGTGTAYADGAAVKLMDNITLYAQWKCNHENSEIRNAKDPTCTETGYTGDTYCKICGEKIGDGKSVPAAGHTEVIDAAEAPTCTEPGKTEGKHCSVCGEVLTAQEVVPATGHTWDEGVITAAATCENAGVKTFTCTVCGETRAEVMEATGHTPENVEKLEPTCTQPGYEAGSRCSVCGAVISGLEEIPATGHTEVIDAAEAPTCTQPGRTEGKHCSVCGEVLTAQEEIPATGHTEVIDAAEAPTCTQPGKTEGKHCSVCGEVLTAQEEIPATGHTEVTDAAEAPTCTQPGKTEGKHCSVCGEVLAAQEVIPAVGHTEKIENAKDATLTEEGYTGDKYCSVCGELLERGQVIPKSGAVITWDVNGVKKTEVYEKGAMPRYNGETPAMEETTRYTYAFTGWEPELSAVSEDVTYTAVFQKTGKNGLCVEGDDTYWIENGENVPFPGLVRIVSDDGHIHYYYFGEDGKAVKNGHYKVEKNNGLPLPAYNYTFDEDGVIVHDPDTSKNGIREGDESVFYYIDGVKVGEGLIRVNDCYYYARTSSGEIVRNRTYWITKNNGLPIKPGMYSFDSDGKMIINGFITENESVYYYVNGEKAKGFTKIDDDYYFFNTGSGRMYKNVTLWIAKNDYGVRNGWYAFGADGKLIKTGFVTGGDGYTYYYAKNVLALGFTKIGEDYYFFNAGSGKMQKDKTLWVGSNDYGIEAGMYYFDADGKMVIPDLENGQTKIVSDNGKLYFTVDGARMRSGLYELDSEYYYAQSNTELAVNKTVWVSQKNGLISEKGNWYAFDGDGKLIKTGFVTGGDGCTYYYNDTVLALGFTKIGNDYYFFNAGSGKLYKDKTLWVGANNYGIDSGMYYFNNDGKMERSNS